MMTPEFETMSREWRDKMLEDWGALAKNMVGTEGFAAASAATMDWSLLWQKQTRSQMGQWLETMEIPKRSDVARINKHVLAVEQRVADVEDRLDEMGTTMKRIASQLEKLNNRLADQPDVSEQLAELTRRLTKESNAAPKAAAPKPAAKTARPRKPSKKQA